jgi:hypothetical protein
MGSQEFFYLTPQVLVAVAQAFKQCPTLVRGNFESFSENVYLAVWTALHKIIDPLLLFKLTPEKAHNAYHRMGAGLTRSRNFAAVRFLVHEEGRARIGEATPSAAKI